MSLYTNEWVDRYIDDWMEEYGNLLWKNIGSIVSSKFIYLSSIHFRLAEFILKLCTIKNQNFTAIFYLFLPHLSTILHHCPPPLHTFLYSTLSRQATLTHGLWIWLKSHQPGDLPKGGFCMKKESYYHIDWFMCNIILYLNSKKTCYNKIWLVAYQ